MKNYKYIVFVFAIFIGLIACGKEDLNPTLSQAKSIENIKTAQDLDGVMQGAYNRMTDRRYYGRNQIIYGEIRTDNVFANGNSGRFVNEGEFNMLPSYGDVSDSWTYIYRVIASTNLVIQKQSDKLTGDKTKINDIKGQAYAIRALAHFDLLKLFGQQHVTGGENKGIPFVTTYGDIKYPNASTVEQIKDSIIKDLTTAKTLLNVNSKATQDVSVLFSDALLSRVYLYFGMWQEAKDAAKRVIDSGKYKIIPKDDYVASFSKDGSVNTIFALAFNNTDNQGINSLGNIYKGDSYGDIEVLENAANIFEEGDVRGMGGIIGKEKDKIRNLGKYPDKNGEDDINIIRYEEVILNYAEALWRLNPTDPEALTTINLITVNRGATALTAIDEDVILNERRKELMFEGFRFDDLMRTKRAIKLVDVNKQTFKNRIPYGDHRLVFPIPIVELDANSNLKQNKGY